MRINKKETKIVIIGGKGERIKLKSEDIDQADIFKYLGSYVKYNMLCAKEFKRIGIVKEVFNRKIKSLFVPLNKGLRKRLPLECSNVRNGNLKA